MEKNNAKLMDCKKAAEYLGLPVSRLRYEVFLGRITRVKIGRSVRFTQQQLDEWIESNSKKAGQK